METLINQDIFSTWLIQYGSIALFVLLTMGIVAFPVPEETLLVFSGILMFKGTLPIHQTILAACAGSISGITISYMIGRTLGYYFFHRYVGWLGITEKHLEQAHNWFERYGKWTLTIGYFIPGVRHFTGFAAGTTELEYQQFAWFAYSGAIAWVSIFLSIGYFFGNYWMALYENIEINIEVVVVLLSILCLGFLAYLLHKKIKN